MVKLCRYSSMYIHRKETLGYVIIFLDCLVLFADIISIKFYFWSSFLLSGSKHLEDLYFLYIYTQVYTLSLKYFNFQSSYLFCFYCQIMHANLNIHIMYADIRDTKTRTASLREKKYLSSLCLSGTFSFT